MTDKTGEGRTAEERANDVASTAPDWLIIGRGGSVQVKYWVLEQNITAAIRAAEDAAIERASKACRDYAASPAAAPDQAETANYCADFIRCLRSDA